MSLKKPKPLHVANRKMCPVCGEVSYSHAGVHPQCAVVRADELGLKLQETALETAKKSPFNPWPKRCAQCGTQIPDLTIDVCACGNTLDSQIP